MSLSTAHTLRRVAACAAAASTPAARHAAAALARLLGSSYASGAAAAAAEAAAAAAASAPARAAGLPVHEQQPSATTTTPRPPEHQTAAPLAGRAISTQWLLQQGVQHDQLPWQKQQRHATLAAAATAVAATLGMRMPARSSVSVATNQVGHGSGGRAGGVQLRNPPQAIPFNVTGLNHIAIAVPDLHSAAEHYRLVFGAQVSEPHPLPEHGVTVVFVHMSNATIELLQPLGESTSPIAKFLEKNPRGGLHHLCFTVDDIEAASEHVSSEGLRVLKPAEAKKSCAGEESEVEADEAQTKTSVAVADVGSSSTSQSKTKGMLRIGAHGNPVLFLDPRDNLGVLCELEQVSCGAADR